MKRILLLNLLFITSYSLLDGQTDSISMNIKDGDHYFGVNIGTTKGLGLSYIYWPKKDGIQLTFLPLLDINNSYISLGVRYLRKVKSYTNSDFYILGESSY
jgi:hypothetical protein